MFASFRASSPTARVGLGGLLLAAACMPSKSLDEYSRENAGGSAGTSTAGSGGSAGASGTGGAGGAAASGGVSGADGDDAGVPPDAASPPIRDAGATITLDGAPPAALCAADERLGPDDRCYFFDATPASWAAASSACQARGAGWDLVRVRTAEESIFLGDELAFEAWIGATDAVVEGQWVWVGDVLPFWIGNGTTGAANGGAYANWNPTEPNGGTATNCARALPRSLGSANPNAPWADLACADPLGAICESGPLE